MSNTTAGIAAGGALGFAVFVTFLYFAIPLPETRHGSDHFWWGALAGLALPIGLVAAIFFSAWKSAP